MKTVIASGREQGSSELKFTNVDIGVQIDGTWNGIHLSIYPRPVTQGRDHEVIVSKEKAEGGPDFGVILNSIIVDGTSDDMAEMGEVYLQRLKSGVNPEMLFQDYEEANSEAMHRLYEELKSKEKR